MPESVYRLRRLIEDSPREYGDIKLPVLPSPWDPRDYKYARIAPIAKYQDLPEETFNREHLPDREKKFDQGNLGTCVAASSCWGFKAQQEITQGDFPKNGLSTRFVYEVCKNIDDIPHEAGTYLRTAMKVLKDYGVPPEAEYPYSGLERDHDLPMPPEHLFESADSFRITTYAQIASVSDKNRDHLVEALCSALAHEGVLEIALMVTESFFDVKPPNYVIPEPEGYILGGHGMRMVDYSKKRKAFLLWNTWGGKWANNDEAWLPFDWVTKYCDPIGDGKYKLWYLFEVWTATDVVVLKRAKDITLSPDSKIAEVDGTEVLLDQEPVILKGRALAPVRFVGNNAGYLVKWDGKNRKIRLIDPSGSRAKRGGRGNDRQ